MSKNQRLLSQLYRDDLQLLCADEKFMRFLFTVFQIAPMYHSAYGTDGRNLAFVEGRRSLGFDMLRSIEQVVGPTALLSVLEAGTKAQKDYHDDLPTQNEHDEELDSPVQHDARTGLDFIDYNAELPKPE